MVTFDPGDVKIPDKLRERIVGWDVKAPRLQYSQYGPINKYLNLKFPDAMVKPQGLMRPIRSNDVEIVVDLEDDMGDEVGNLSVDSTGECIVVNSPLTNNISQDSMSQEVMKSDIPTS